MKAFAYGGPGKMALEKRPRPCVQAATEPQPPSEQRERAQASDLEWDLVDEASSESFPASDAPGWISRRRSVLEVSIRREPSS
jgi:hypothetical protein